MLLNALDFHLPGILINMNSVVQKLIDVNARLKVNRGFHLNAWFIYYPMILNLKTMKRLDKIGRISNFENNLIYLYFFLKHLRGPESQILESDWLIARS